MNENDTEEENGEDVSLWKIGGMAGGMFSGALILAVGVEVGISTNPAVGLFVTLVGFFILISFSPPFKGF